MNCLDAHANSRQCHRSNLQLLSCSHHAYKEPSRRMIQELVQAWKQLVKVAARPLPVKTDVYKKRTRTQPLSRWRMRRPVI